MKVITSEHLTVTFYTNELLVGELVSPQLVSPQPLDKSLALFGLWGDGGNYNFINKELVDGTVASNKDESGPSNKELVDVTVLSNSLILLKIH